MNQTITLQNQDGEQTDFDILGHVTYENNEYVVLYPIVEDDGEVLILKVDENKYYSSIDDDDLIETLFNIFKEQYQDEYFFEDDEEMEDVEDFEIEIDTTIN